MEMSRSWFPLMSFRAAERINSNVVLLVCLSLPCRRHSSSVGSFCLEISFSFSLLFWNCDDVHCLELGDHILPWSCSHSQDAHSHQLGRISLRYRREKFGGRGGFKKNISAFCCWIFFFIVSQIFLGLKRELITLHDSQCTAGSSGPCSTNALQEGLAELTFSPWAAEWLE